MLYLPVRNNEIIYLDGIETWYTYKNYNLRNTWNSICMSIDFKNDDWKFYINGNKNLTYLYRKNR